jgi:hypothetical protein
VVKYLSSKCEALNSNPSTTKKNSDCHVGNGDDGGSIDGEDDKKSQC